MDGLKVEPGYSGESRHPNYSDYDPKLVESRGNYNSHPAAYVRDLNHWIDADIIPLVEIFNTKRFETGATCQGDEKYSGEFNVIPRCGTTRDEMFVLAKRVENVLSSVPPYSEQGWGIDLKMNMCGGGIVMYFRNEYLAAITKAFLNFDPELDAI
jgi:hypothetical protein